MKGKGWKLNPHWVIYYAQRAHVRAAQRAEREFHEQQAEMLKMIERTESQARAATKH